MALSVLLLAMLKIDLSSANSFEVLFNPFGISLIDTRKGRGPNMDLWGKPARVGLYDEFCPFKTTNQNLLER